MDGKYTALFPFRMPALARGTGAMQIAASIFPFSTADRASAMATGSVKY